MIFLVGIMAFIVGLILGVLTTCLCVTASNNEKDYEKFTTNKHKTSEESQVKK